MGYRHNIKIVKTTNSRFPGQLDLSPSSHGTAHFNVTVVLSPFTTTVQPWCAKRWRVQSTAELAKISLYFHRKEFRRIHHLHPDTTLLSCPDRLFTLGRPNW